MALEACNEENAISPWEYLTVTPLKRLLLELIYQR